MSLEKSLIDHSPVFEALSLLITRAVGLSRPEVELVSDRFAIGKAIQCLAAKLSPATYINVSRGYCYKGIKEYIITNTKSYIVALLVR